MSNYRSLQHVFLIATPQLLDPDFSHAVVYLWEYGEQGASGVIVNKPSNIHLGEILRQIEVKDVSWYTENYPLLYGGPVASDQVFVVRRERTKMKDDQGNTIFNIKVSADTRRTLTGLATADWEGEAIVTLGCSVWSPGQLDKELANNDWLVIPFNEATLFGTALEDREGRNSTDIWYSAAARAGIDLSRLSPDVGHA